MDHLGSLDAITDEKGVVEKRSYDAFGQRRNPQWGAPSSAFTTKVTKGYTGHEADDDIGLVNMRGRLYDPRIARFTTTDPIIANVYNGQSLAAYSYVLNNPLTLIDPSGFNPVNPSDPPKPPILPIAERVTKEADGSITVELLYPPREGQPPKALPPTSEAATCGASAPPVDTNTTGHGGESLPQETQDAEPVQGPTLTDAIGSGLQDAVRNFWDDWTTPAWEVAFRMHDAYEQGDGLDAFNQVNPLIAFANISLAADDGDEYSVTRQSVAMGVTVIVGVIVGKVVAGKTGAGTGERTRGPKVKPSHANGSAGTRPPNMSPQGAARHGALNEAKRQNNIPTSQQPEATGPNVDRHGNPQPGRHYVYRDLSGKKVIIRDDAAGHDYGPGNPQNRGPHFNDEAGKHYDY